MSFKMVLVWKKKEVRSTVNNVTMTSFVTVTTQLNEQVEAVVSFAEINV